MRNYKLSVIIEMDKDGCYAYCPELQGCYTQGNSYEEVLDNIRDAIEGYLYVRSELLAGKEIREIDISFPAPCQRSQA